MEAPHWFGEICLFDGQPRTHDAYGVGQCTLLHIPQNDAAEDCWTNSRVHWRQLALLMSQKLRMTFINLEQLSLLPAPARLAHRLLMIAEGYGELDEPRRVLQLPQEQLAADAVAVAPDHQPDPQGFAGAGDYCVSGTARSKSSMLQRLRALVAV